MTKTFMAVVLAALAVSAVARPVGDRTKPINPQAQADYLAREAVRTNADYVADEVLLADIKAANNVAQLKAALTRMVKSRAVERQAERKAHGRAADAKAETKKGSGR